MSPFIEFGAYLGAQGSVQAVAQTAVNGGSLGENLQLSLTNQVYHLLQATGFNAVGNASTANGWVDGSPEKIALHAIVGGMLNEATGGDFETGALAAGANEALIEQLAGVIKDDKSLELAVSQLIGIASATATGGDYAKAAELAKNATAYNRQLHPEEVKLIKGQAEMLAEELGISPAEAERRLAEAQAYLVDEQFRKVIDEKGVVIDEATLRHLGTAEPMGSVSLILCSETQQTFYLSPVPVVSPAALFWSKLLLAQAPVFVRDVMAWLDVLLRCRASN
ncbi:DUF637 domain-containing protein [Halopseudomonas sp.]|uniref:DUF637 domain-containing protein n=1 Tax=Halopseudomonas sp. TaxID=2901191 RepID=UPI003002E045